MATVDDILYGDDNLYKLKKVEASVVVAEKIEQMQRLYQEVMVLADEHELYVNVTLEHPEGMRLGHNCNHHADVAWNPSSKRC
jgi:hypothetical protein